MLVVGIVGGSVAVVIIVVIITVVCAVVFFFVWFLLFLYVYFLVIFAADVAVDYTILLPNASFDLPVITKVGFQCPQEAQTTRVCVVISWRTRNTSLALVQSGLDG